MNQTPAIQRAFISRIAASGDVRSPVVNFVVPMVSEKFQLDERAPIHTYNFKHLFNLTMHIAQVVEEVSTKRRFPFFKKCPSRNVQLVVTALQSVAGEIAKAGNPDAII